MSRVAPEQLYRVDANPKVAADDEAASTAPGTTLAVAVAVAKMSKPRNKRKNRRAMLRVAGACALSLGLTLFGAAKIILSYKPSSDAQLWTHVTGALAFIGIAAGVAIAVGNRHATGGIVITASHNPAQWNGIKTLRHDGLAPPPDQAQAIIDRFKNGQIDWADVEGYQPVDEFDEAATIHVEAVLAHVDVEAIKN